MAIDEKGIPTVVNRFGSTTLAQNLNQNTTASCVLTDASGLPDGSNGGCIQIESEIIYFESRTGNTLFVLRRGRDGTTAVAHDAGATVTSQIVAGNFNSLKSAVIELDINKYELPDGGTVDQYIDGTGALQDIPAYQDADTVIVPVRNQTGATLPQGAVVYISGNSGNKLLVAPADADDENSSSKTIGLVRSQMLNNSDGFVVLIGTIEGIDTTIYQAGEALWLSQTPGQFTNIKPISPAHLVQIGFADIIGNSSSGTIFVRVDNGYELEELHDVLITNPLQNQVLKRNGTGLWTNQTLQISDTNGLQSALDGKVDENAPITAATKTKITYDSKGLVTAGSDAGIADIAGLQTALDAKVTANALIVGSTKTKITYDNKGLVTSGEDATTDDISEGLINKYYPSADAAKLAGIEPGAEVNNISDLDATDLTDGGDSTLHFHESDRNRANHTGTQTASTISDFDTEVSNNTSVLANTAKISADGSINTHSDVDTATAIPATGQALIWDGTNWIPGNVVKNPAGANTEIQFNSNGVFGASANLIYDGSLKVKGLGTTNATQSLNVANSSSTNLFSVRDDGSITGNYIAVNEYPSSLRMGVAAAASATGSNWLAFGGLAAQNNVTGGGWTAIGRTAGNGNISGSNWTAIGISSGLNNVEGSGWIAIGYRAGRFAAGGTGTNPLVYFENSVYLGTDTKGVNGTDVAPTVNETVIGYAAEGNGSNTVTIGSSAITDNYFNGKLHATSSVQVGNDADTASAANVGAIRYRVGANDSYAEMVMQITASDYAWVIIKQNTWS